MTFGKNGIAIYSKEEVAVLYQKEREKQLGLTAEEKEIEELKAQLWGAKSTCNNWGNADCENYQRQRRSAPCELWISHRDKIIMSKEIIRNLLCLLEDYKEQIVFDEDLQKIKKAEDFLNN